MNVTVTRILDDLTRLAEAKRHRIGEIAVLASRDDLTATDHALLLGEVEGIRAFLVELLALVQVWEIQ